MSKKLTTEDFILKARQVHGWRYDYSKVNYINNRAKVCIICPEHGEFWQDVNCHLRGSGCKECANLLIIEKTKKDKDWFIFKSKQVHGNKYDYSKVEYNGCYKDVCIICPIHGEFWQKPTKHLTGRGCNLCKIEKLKEVNTKDNEYFIKRAKEKHGDKYDYSKSEYKGLYTPIIIGCHRHGWFLQKPASHYRSGCPKCAGNIKLSNEEFIKRCKEIHKNKYKYSNKVLYENQNTKMLIICPIHGEFYQRANSHLRGVGCPKCSASHGELKINEYLTKNNIEYKSQYSVKLEKQMFSRNRLKIDFYLPKYNTFIEFNGIQHYEFTSAFHKSEDDFQKQVERDKRLKDYCNGNKIKLIVIKYNQIDKIEEILNKKLKIN